jgi:hypothetical protein
VGLAGATRAGVHARVWMGGSHSRPGKRPTVFVAAVVVQAQSPRPRGPFRPSGGRGRGPTPTGPRGARPEDRLRVGKVRWAAPQTGSSAPLPPASAGEGKGRVVRATLRRQIFEKPVVTLSPDSPAGCGEGWGETLRKRRPLAASETKKSKTLEDNYYPPSFSWQGKPKSVEPEVGDVAGVLF